MTRLEIAAATAVASVVGAALWWRKHPSACPYSQRFWVEAPHPFITRERLGEAHMVGERSLRRRATAAGLRFERRIGPRWGYFAGLRRAPQ